MANDKIIQFDGTEERSVHRLLGKMPEFHRRYGLWIINAGQGGHSPADSFEHCLPRTFEFYSISHLIEGGGKLWLEGRGEQLLYPGQLIVITPGTVNRYGGAEEKPYVEDSVRFCGPVADGLKASGALTDGAYEFGMARKLLTIVQLIQDPSPPAQIEANITLQDLLVGLYLSRRKANTVTPMEELLEAVKQRSSHWWTVEEMAEFCNLSSDQLRRNFRRHTGMLPKAYLEGLKLRQAADLLLSSRLPVAEIALQLGYRDPYHFSRRFKHYAGASPELYRREISGGIKA